MNCKNCGFGYDPGPTNNATCVYCSFGVDCPHLVDEASRCEIALQTCAAGRVYKAKKDGDEDARLAAQGYLNAFSALPGIDQIEFWAHVARSPDGIQHVFKAMLETYARQQQTAPPTATL